MPATLAEVTRFAPSPTGLMHLGHAYAAMVAEDLARKTGGRLLLRIDDIDFARCRAEFETMIYEDLAWLGIAWETPVRRQSECLIGYNDALDKLRGMGLTYPCFCTRKEILQEAARAPAAPHGMEGSLYPGTCHTVSLDERNARMNAGDAYALRLDLAAASHRSSKRIWFTELGAGPQGECGGIDVKPSLMGDIVLARGGAQGLSAWAYHLAVVVDDAAQGISCVTRGRDLFYATHVQRLLQVLLGFPAPRYLHHGLVVDAAGKRLAKRHDAVSLRQLRLQGMTVQQVRDLAHQSVC